MTLSKKAHAVSYAIFRIVENFKRVELRTKLENKAINLLDAIISSDYESARKIIPAVHNFAILAEGLGEVSYHNSQILLRELSALDALIGEELLKNTSEKFNLDDIFSGNLLASGAGDSLLLPNNEAVVSKEVAARQPASGNNRKVGAEANINKVADFTNQNSRQSAIVSIIKQRGNSQLKDVLNQLPNYSERTIRYDLQKLCEEGKLERVGTTGPGTYYRMRG